MEHAYALRYTPVPRLMLAGSFLESNYADAFTARTLDVFSPEFLGKDERLTKTAGHIEYRLTREISATADVAGYSYKTRGNAFHYGGGIAATLSQISGGLQLHRMDGDAERLRYTELRFYGKSIVAKCAVSIDAILLRYDRAVGGMKNAYSINGTVSRAVTKSLTAGLSTTFERNPDFTSSGTVLFRVAYNLRR
jgi:hypothetical protein